MRSRSRLAGRAGSPSRWRRGWPRVDNGAASVDLSRWIVGIPSNSSSFPHRRPKIAIRRDGSAALNPQGLSVADAVPPSRAMVGASRLIPLDGFILAVILTEFGGIDGNRTHPGRLRSAPQTVLKAAGVASMTVHQLRLQIRRTY